MGLAAQPGERAIDDDPRQKTPPGQGRRAQGRKAGNRALIASDSSLSRTGTRTFLATFDQKAFRRFELV